MNIIFLGGIAHPLEVTFSVSEIQIWIQIILGDIVHPLEVVKHLVVTTPFWMHTSTYILIINSFFVNSFFVIFADVSVAVKSILGETYQIFW